MRSIISQTGLHGLEGGGTPPLCDARTGCWGGLVEGYDLLVQLWRDEQDGVTALMGQGAAGGVNNRADRSLDIQRVVGQDGVGLVADLDFAETYGLVDKCDGNSVIGLCGTWMHVHKVREGVDGCGGGHSEYGEGRVDHWSFPFVARCVASRRACPPWFSQPFRDVSYAGGFEVVPKKFKDFCGFIGY